MSCYLPQKHYHIHSHNLSFCCTTIKLTCCLLILIGHSTSMGHICIHNHSINRIAHKQRNLIRCKYENVFDFFLFHQWKNRQLLLKTNLSGNQRQRHLNWRKKTLKMFGNCVFLIFICQIKLIDFSIWNIQIEQCSNSQSTHKQQLSMNFMSDRVSSSKRPI